MKRREILVYAVVIGLLNAPLIWGGFAESMILLPDKVIGGEWWRVLSHPFVHVSWYHLLLDGAAFFLLYSQLGRVGFIRRTVYVFGSALGGMAAAMLSLPGSGAYGYCGLSGLGHGLMAVCSLELIFGDEAGSGSRRAGMISLAMVAGKSVLEAVSGRMFLGFLHPDLLGIPIAAAHLGGVSAGCITWLLTNSKAAGGWLRVNSTSLRQGQRLSRMRIPGQGA